MFAMQFYELIGVNSSAAIEILSVSIMMIAGFLLSRVTKLLKLPNVTAYIVAGILIGPFCLDLIPAQIVSGTDFLPDIALAFIAFGTGEFFKLEALRKNGMRVVLITLTEALLASALVFALCIGVLGLPLPFSVVLAALAAATAPASTMMTIRQLHAKGEFVDTLMQVVALDNIVGLLSYSVAISIATTSLSTGNIDPGKTLLPLLWNILSIFLGGGFGAATAMIMKTRHSSDNRLIITVTMLFFFCGISALLETSPLLGCMTMGMVYINITDDERLFRQIAYFNPPILMLFFVRSGVSFDLKSLFARNAVIGGYPLIIIGIGYFLARIVGKYGGSLLGGRMVRASAPIRRYLGMALIPQAGVAIGLSELGARTLGGEPGVALQTIILASSVLYELIGPVSAKASLYLSGSCTDDPDAGGPEESDRIGSGSDPAGTTVEKLIEQIQKIQRDLKEEEESNLLDEKIFSEEADLFYEESVNTPVRDKKPKKDKTGRQSIKKEKKSK